MSIELILEDIKKALDGEAYYAALSAAITLPEVCGRCELDDPFSTKGPNRSEMIYDRFVSTNLPDWQIGLDGSDLFKLRCGLSHRGKTDRRSDNVRFVFHPPDQNQNSVYANELRDRSTGAVFKDIDLHRFCSDISDAVRRWYDLNKGSPTVIRNLERIIQKRPAGFGTDISIEGQYVLG